MFSVRVTPWHGLGAVLDQPPATLAEAIEASGLGWSVAKEPIAIDRGETSAADWSAARCEEIPGFYATVRQDTREVLGIVSRSLGGRRDRRRRRAGRDAGRDAAAPCRLEDIVSLAVNELAVEPLREDWELLLHENRA
jgi:hypothetical protein